MVRWTCSDSRMSARECAVCRNKNPAEAGSCSSSRWATVPRHHPGTCTQPRRKGNISGVNKRRPTFYTDRLHMTSPTRCEFVDPQGGRPSDKPESHAAPCAGVLVDASEPLSTCATGKQREKVMRPGFNWGIRGSCDSGWLISQRGSGKTKNQLTGHGVSPHALMQNYGRWIKGVMKPLTFEGVCPCGRPLTTSTWKTLTERKGRTTCRACGRTELVRRPLKPKTPTEEKK
jgi:hypothetical protein